MADDLHHTDGNYYRIPASPAIVHALGRAMANFFYLEELVAAILYEGNAMGLTAVRRMTAGGKANALSKYIADLSHRRPPPSAEVLATLETAHVAFDGARARYRNALSHAHPYTAGHDEQGRSVMGLAHTSRDGRYWVVASTPEELHAIAHEFEKVMDLLTVARSAVALNKLANAGRGR